MNDAIKSTVETRGWDFIEELFYEEILEGKKPLNFNTEGKTNEVIAREVAAREMAAKMVDKVLKKIKRIASSEEPKKEVYR